MWVGRFAAWIWDELAIAVCVRLLLNLARQGTRAMKVRASSIVGAARISHITESVGQAAEALVAVGSELGDAAASQLLAGRTEGAPRTSRGSLQSA
jgi:hypothetical protein